MNDNEKIERLVSSIVSAVNEAQLPLGVKALALENVLFRVKSAIWQQEAAPPKPAEKEVPQE